MLALEKKISLILVGILLWVMIFGSFRVGTEKSSTLLSRNKLYADFSQNIYPQKYNAEFLDSLEENSVLMTEGRDTEVFTSLYYMFVEGKRPDVDIFDREGNIFPRLYGDMYHPPVDYQWIVDLRDFEMFSMDKSVYLNWNRQDIGQLSLPYLEQKRKELKVFFEKHPEAIANSVSFGFKISDRPSLEKTLLGMVDHKIFNPVFRNGETFSSKHLHDLGPWYLKQYGLLYKVLNIRYALLDVLEVFHEIDLATLRDAVEMISHLRINDEMLKTFLAKLQEEGYVVKKDSSYVFKKNLPRVNENYPNQEAYETIDQSYLKVVNAPYWDYLTRDIFVRRAVVLSRYHVLQYRLIKMAEGYWKNKDSQKNQFYEASLRKHQTFVKETLKRVAPYMDIAGMNMEVFSLLDDVDARQELVDMILKIRVENDNRYELDYSLAEGYRELAEENDNEELFSKAINYYQTALHKLNYYAKQREVNVKKLNNYQIIDMALRQARSEKEHPKSYIKAIEEKIKREGKVEEMKVLADIFFERQNYEYAASLYSKIFISGSKNDRLLIWRKWQQSVNIRNKADEIVFVMESILGSDIRNDVAEMPGIFRNLLDILIYWGDKSRENGKLEESKKHYLEAYQFIKKYQNDEKFNFLIKKYRTMIEDKLRG